MSDLQLSDITVDRRGVRVLDQVSARFLRGRLTAVIGPNRAGKSTLLSVAAGLLHPDVGTVTLGEESLIAMDRRALARRRAYLPQSPRVEWLVSVERVVALGLTPTLPVFGDLNEAHRLPVERALQAHDLLALRSRPATELSGGELARVMLARATVGDSEVLIVDEPIDSSKRRAYAASTIARKIRLRDRRFRAHRRECAGAARRRW